jgi:pimeloyl-ACP methyl ester carboxylesterase
MSFAVPPGTTGMDIVKSKDGTAIAFERTGAGPPLILVDGALCYRRSGPSRALAEKLAPRFTVYTYDRRGRGESGDAAPYAVEREIEDLEALIGEAGGSAGLAGVSSGAVLALDAANSGLPVTRLALYEPPFIVDDSRPPLPDDYRAELDRLLESDRRADMLKLFMRQVGMPGWLLALMPLMPAWKRLKAIAHTLRYDAAVMGATQSGRPLPAGRWANVTAPTLVAVGGKSEAWMQHGTHALADLLPNAEHQLLPGQTHMVKAKVVAPALAEFLAGEEPARAEDGAGETASARLMG